MSDLSGRVFVVSGGAAGIGYHTSFNLLSRGATVLVGGRTPSKVEAVIAELERDHPDWIGRIKFFLMNFDSIEGAKLGAERVLAMTDRIDGLVNNAGRLSSAGDYELSVDGFEMLVAVNHFGTFTFTKTLLPLLIKTARLADSDVRVVTVASKAHVFVDRKVQFTSPESFNDACTIPFCGKNTSIAKFGRYSLSKMLNIIFNAELQRAVDDEGVDIACVAIHPGTVATDKLLVYGWFITMLLQFFAYTPAHGALTTLFALTDPAIKQQPKVYKGKYLVPFSKVVEPTAPGTDILVSRQVWQISEEVLARDRSKQ